MSPFEHTIGQAWLPATDSAGKAVTTLAIILLRVAPFRLSGVYD